MKLLAAFLVGLVVGFVAGGIWEAAAWQEELDEAFRREDELPQTDPRTTELLRGRA